MTALIISFLNGENTARKKTTLEEMVRMGLNDWKQMPRIDGYGMRTQRVPRCQ